MRCTEEHTWGNGYGKPRIYEKEDVGIDVVSDRRPEKLLEDEGDGEGLIHPAGTQLTVGQSFCPFAEL